MLFFFLINELYKICYSTMRNVSKGQAPVLIFQLLNNNSANFISIVKSVILLFKCLFDGGGIITLSDISLQSELNLQGQQNAL